VLLPWSTMREMAAQLQPRMTYPQFLEFERTSDAKHEFLRGEVWAMAGGTPSHALLAANVGGQLTTALRGRPCAVFNADLRVRVEATDRSTYPDVTVVCGKREHANDDPNAVTNPIVLVEVLSEGTEASDRGEKFAHYQRLVSLCEYVLVSQSSHRVEVFTRDGNNVWRYQAFGDGQVVALDALGVSLDVSALYLDPTA
jgi:Uma2 family endonuclease